jgi:hypothetical protein
MNIRQRILREYLHWDECTKDCLRWFIRYRRMASKVGIFSLGGVEYPYFFHPYNHTWENERAVEIPVIRRLSSSAPPSSTLEVGNVLSHYFDVDHAVLDKWERCRYRPIINRDLVQFNPQERFDLVVSISTIEHVGWDESPRDETLVINAIRKLQCLLTPTGKAVVTIPIGYNHFLDQRLPELVGDGVFAQCLKRISQDNRWIEVDLTEALGCKYGEPFGNANAVVFLSLCATAPHG